MNSRHLARGGIALAKHHGVCCGLTSPESGGGTLSAVFGRAKFSKARDSSRRAPDLPTLDRIGPFGCQSVPSCSRKRWASSAAMQPVPALVIAWRYTWSCTSPAAKTPGTLVIVAKPCRPERVTM